MWSSGYKYSAILLDTTTGSVPIVVEAYWRPVKFQHVTDLSSCADASRWPSEATNQHPGHLTGANAECVVVLGIGSYGGFY